VRCLRDRQALEHIRMQAGALFATGRSQAEVARTLGVAGQNVSRWLARWVAEDWPQDPPQRPPPTGGDRVLGRVGRLPAAVTAAAGRPRQHPGCPPPLPLEALLDGRLAARPARFWLVTERLSGYAPELDPVEGLLANLKGWSWPTWPATPLTRSPRPRAAFNASE
jgi:hypothetical protein